MEDIAADGEYVPELEDRPEVDPWNVWLWRAWLHLSRSRGGGLGALPIPISEIKAYVEFRHPEMDLDEREEFLQAIEQLDGIFLKHTAEERKREEQQPKGSGAGG